MREPDPAEMAARYDAETPVLDWRERLVWSGGSGPAGSDHRWEISGRRPTCGKSAPRRT